MQRRHSANQSARMYYTCKKDIFDVASQPCLQIMFTYNTLMKKGPRPIREHVLHLRYFHLSLTGGKFKFARNYRKKKVISFHFIAFITDGHLANLKNIYKDKLQYPFM